MILKNHNFKYVSICCTDSKHAMKYGISNAEENICYTLPSSRTLGLVTAKGTFFCTLVPLLTSVSLIYHKYKIENVMLCTKGIPYSGFSL